MRARPAPADAARRRAARRARTARPFRLLRARRAVGRTDGPRRAAISAFGFGGNNAHLIVEAVDDARIARRTCSAAPRGSAPSRSRSSASARAWPTATSAADFARALLRPARPRHAAAREPVDVELERPALPAAATSRRRSPQQLLMLEAAREATRASRSRASAPRCSSAWGATPRSRATARAGACRMGGALASAGRRGVDRVAEAARDAMQPALEAAGVVGTMPNIPANRLNSQLDLAGPASRCRRGGCPASSRSSSPRARCARRDRRRARRRGRPVARAGAPARRCGPLGRRSRPRRRGGGAGAQAPRRRAARRRPGPTRLLDETRPSPRSASATRRRRSRPRRDRSASARGQRPAARRRGRARAAPRRATAVGARGHCPGSARACAERRGLGARGAAGARAAATPATARPLAVDAPPQLHVFSGARRKAEPSACARGRRRVDARARRGWCSSPPTPPSSTARAQTRAAMAASGRAARRRASPSASAPIAASWRSSSPAPPPPIRAWAASSRSRLPEAGRRRRRALRGAAPRDGLALRARRRDAAHPLDQLWGTSFLCQLHAELTRGAARTLPQATIGYSSGEIERALRARRVERPRRDDAREPRRARSSPASSCGAFEAPRTGVGAARRCGRDAGRTASCPRPSST